MKKWIVILFAMLPSLAMAAGANVPLDKANVTYRIKLRCKTARSYS
ncbi:ubiquinol-cytochrome c oxidoreductase, cytochrome c1 subunit [Vibrio sp. JCM 19052]|nr:ubiquinol-cytochrome c oxidoreductase, cytochrome c1 subunit [Vibrio sp. JCM 19052]